MMIAGVFTRVSTFAQLIWTQSLYVWCGFGIRVYLGHCLRITTVGDGVGTKWWKSKNPVKTESVLKVTIWCFGTFSIILR